MRIQDKIFVAGHKGMVGSAIVRLLKKRGFNNLLLRARDELDLRDAVSVNEFFERERPAVVILAAGRVGGILANSTYPADFLYENLAIQNNVIHLSHKYGSGKFCFLGSSCIYPRECPQPMKEEYLMTGPLEPTNEGYALAKIAGLKMVEFYRRQYGFCGISVMPCNLYGTNDSFDPHESHVLSALVKRFVDAVDAGLDEISLWGTGSARREFMHVDDAAGAIMYLIEQYDSPQLMNIGSGEDISIKDLASLVALRVGFTGKISWDASKPDGMPRKLLDVSRMKALGFAPEITLEEGIKKTIEEYRILKDDDKQK
ncbi:MAG: GDP-L-fucose synthase [Candidatus Brocadiaceae bacterium]|nr:GDP-L-fucose synthase [Candidatus Brocadiaceae bacterium]